MATASALQLSSMQAALQTAVDAQRQRSATAVASLDAFVQQSMSDVTSLKVLLMYIHLWASQSTHEDIACPAKAHEGK